MASEDGSAETGIVPRDKYRSHMYGEGEKDTQWRHGRMPKYDLVNMLFEEGRAKEWPKGSLEEAVQNAIKTWEMEVSYKIRFQDFKTVNHDKFSLSVNGRKGLTGEEILAVGACNALLQTSLPPEHRYYSTDTETCESTHDIFSTAFPRGFAWEVLQVYSPPPLIVFKYRHWGYFEGPFKEFEPTGENIEFTGVAVLKVDEQLRAEDVEIYFDPGELLGGLLKGKKINSGSGENATAMLKKLNLDATAGCGGAAASGAALRCPFFKEA